MNKYKIRQITEHMADVVVGMFVKQNVKYAKLTYGLNEQEMRTPKIIISLTTYNKRYDAVCYALKSLLLQTVKPDRIIVWLDENTPENRITTQMAALEQYGVEYRHTNLNLKPHTKYYYAMKEFPDDIIITADDDLIYPKNMVKSLIRVYQKYPDAVCARRVHLMTFDTKGNLMRYNDWKYEYRGLKTPSYLLCATGVGGVLYPPHILPEETFAVDAIRQYCLNADDIWLKVMEIQKRVKVVWAKNFLVLPPIVKNSQKKKLSDENVTRHRNDAYIQNLQRQYPLVFAFLADTTD